LAAFLAALLCTVASAQRPGGGGGFGGGFPGGFTMQNKADTIMGDLKLKKEARPDVEAILDAAQKEATPLNKQIADARLAIIQANLASQSDEAAVKNLQGLSAQMIKIEADVLAKLLAKAEPKNATASKAADVSETIAGMFRTGNWRMAR
jgi:Spy/CpxP family protein refolding chaperone